MLERSTDNTQLDGAAGSVGFVPRTLEEALLLIDPAALIVAARYRVGRDGKLDPEDAVQETLLRAVGAWNGHRWQGARAFRAWLLVILEHVVIDAHERASTLKRGAGAGHVGDVDNFLDGLRGKSTSPLRKSVNAERAAIYLSTIEALSDDVREIVRLRLILLQTPSAISLQVSLPVTTVQHRIRRGVIEFARQLRARLGSFPALTTKDPAKERLNTPECRSNTVLNESDSQPGVSP